MISPQRTLVVLITLLSVALAVVSELSTAHAAMESSSRPEAWTTRSFQRSDLPCLPPTRPKQFRIADGHSQDNAYMMMAASYLAYSFWPGKRERILSSWGFDSIHIFDSSEHSTNGFWAAHKDFVLVALRGTQEPTDLLTDVTVRLKPMSEIGAAGAQVHEGFFTATLSIQTFIRAAHEHALKSKVPLVLTGHSLGGAIALLSALMLEPSQNPVHALWTFGLPKVGNNDFLNAALNRLSTRWHRINQPSDPIPLVPFSRHEAGRIEKLSSDYGNYLGLLNELAANANYWDNTLFGSGTMSTSPSLFDKKPLKIARGFLKHLPRSYVCDLADQSLLIN